MLIRPAIASDVPAITQVVNRAYRTEGGWTTEAHLLTAARITEDGVSTVIAQPGTTLLTALDDDVVGCCQVDLHGSYAYFGMFAVDPARQANGAGRALLAAAEKLAAEAGAAEMRMIVVAQRSELLDWYARRGYSATGRTENFPTDHAHSALVPAADLVMSELTKPL